MEFSFTLELINFIVTSLTLVPLLYLFKDTYAARKKLRSSSKLKANTGLLILFIGYLITTVVGLTVNLGRMVFGFLTIDELGVKTLVINFSEMIVVWWFYFLDREIKNGGD